MMIRVPSIKTQFSEFYKFIKVGMEPMSKTPFSLFQLCCTEKAL